MAERLFCKQGVVGSIPTPGYEGEHGPIMGRERPGCRLHGELFCWQRQMVVDPMRPPIHMNALPIICVLLTTFGIKGECVPLPPHSDAYRFRNAAQEFVNHTTHCRDIGGGFYADRLNDVLIDANQLLQFWVFVANGTDTQYTDFAWRQSQLEEARHMHDWTIYGWPPCIPYWYLPTWGGE